MYRQPAVLRPIPESIFPSLAATLRYIVPLTQPQHEKQQGGSGEIQLQQRLHILAFTLTDTITTHRSRRTGPLSLAANAKAAVVRRERGSFRCSALIVGYVTLIIRLRNAEINLLGSVTTHDQVQDAKLVGDNS